TQGPTASTTIPSAERPSTVRSGNGLSAGSSTKGTLLAHATGTCSPPGSCVSTVNQPSGGLNLVGAPSTSFVAPQPAEPAAIKTTRMASLAITVLSLLYVSRAPGGPTKPRPSDARSITLTGARLTR